MKKSELRQIIKEEIKLISEQEAEEDGMKSSRSALLGSTKTIRIVIEGPGLKENQSEIMALVKKHDPNHKIQYYETTGKLVGTFAQYKLDGLKRDVKKYNVKVTDKPQSQSLVKK